MATPEERVLDALVDLQRSTNLAGVRVVHDSPPNALTAFPALWNELVEQESAEFFDGDVPSGRQYLTEVIEILVATNMPDRRRAHDQLLPIADALRIAVNAHRTLQDSAGEPTCLAAIWRGFTMGLIPEGAEERWHGMTCRVRVTVDLPGNFAD